MNRTKAPPAAYTDCCRGMDFAAAVADKAMKSDLWWNSFSYLCSMSVHGCTEVNSFLK